LFGAGRPFFAGARAVFERFAEYQPRAGGPVGFTAGPKVAHFERVEWLTLDPFFASAALRRGEIDWVTVHVGGPKIGFLRGNPSTPWSLPPLSPKRLASSART
jgi:peptide/nickel transport system substrate-binding protein